MAGPNSAYPELVATTVRHQHKKGKVIDNFTNNNALLTLVKERGNIKTDADSGTEIVVSLSYQNNGTYQRYRGGEVLDIGASDVITAAKYDWMQASIHVYTEGRELRINRSDAQMVNLAKAKTDVAIGTAANQMAVDLFSDGSLTNQIGGLSQLVSNTGAGTVGGIDSSAYPFWQNKVQEMSAPATFSALRTDMQKLWQATTRGNDKTDLIVLTHDLYATYIGGLQDLQRYADAKMAGLGFEALKFNTAPVIFDDNTNFGTAAKTGYFLNTKYLYLMQHPDAQWTEDEAKKPINQDAIVVPMYWMGNMVCTNRARQGKLVDLV